MWVWTGGLLLFGWVWFDVLLCACGLFVCFDCVCFRFACVYLVLYGLCLIVLVFVFYNLDLVVTCLVKRYLCWGCFVDCVCCLLWLLTCVGVVVLDLGWLTVCLLCYWLGLFAGDSVCAMVVQDGFLVDLAC